MKPLSLSHYTLVSAIGPGRERTFQALRDGISGLRRSDLDWLGLDTYIGRVEGLEDVALSPALSRYDCRNNRLARLALETDGFAGEVRALIERYGDDRVALILGTSTAGIAEAEIAYAARDGDGNLPASFAFAHTQDYYSVAAFVQDYFGLCGPAAVISTACSSSAKTFVDAGQLIEAGLCDAAIVGGVDSLCRMTCHGFDALGLLSEEACRPNDLRRSGMSIGEAAGFAILEPPEEAARRGNGGGAASVLVLGYGESSDGHHMSTPDPEGAGARLSMLAALERARLAPDDIDYVNLHGTGTKINDLVEDKAVLAVFGDSTPCSSTKGWTGHALGSAGIVEIVIAALCIERSHMPRNLNLEQPDPSFGSHILVESVDRPVRRVLTNSFGFGGNNCSIVLGDAA